VREAGQLGELSLRFQSHHFQAGWDNEALFLNEHENGDEKQTGRWGGHCQCCAQTIGTGHFGTLLAKATENAQLPAFETLRVSQWPE